MRRWTIPMIALALLAAACGDDAGTAPTATPAPTTTASTTPPASTTEPTAPPASTGTTEAPGTAAPPASSSTTTTEARPPLPDDAVPAPDFDFVLADGSTFSLRDAAMPIYMVFWAEW